MSSCGPRGGIGASNTGTVFVRLKPRSERTAGPDEIIQRLRPKLARDPRDPRLPPEPAPDPDRRRADQEPVPVHAPGPGHGRALPRARRCSSRGCGRFRASRTSRQRPADQEPAGRTSRSTGTRRPPSASPPRKIEDALYTAYGSRQVSTIYAPNNQYAVILEVDPEYPARRLGPLAPLRPLGAGRLVPLSSVAKMSPGLGPLSVNHAGQLPSVTISFNLAARRLDRRRRDRGRRGSRERSCPAR